MGQLADYHMGRLVQCVMQTVANQQITKKEKYQELQKIIDDPYTEFAKRNALNASKKIAILSIPIRMKSKKLCYLMGWGVCKIQGKLLRNLLYNACFRSAGSIAC